MINLAFLWFLLYFVDAFGTYMTVKHTNYNVEVNPLYRFLFKKFGLNFGIIMGLVVGATIITIVSQYLQWYMMLFLIGAYCIIFVIHIQNGITLIYKQDYNKMFNDLKIKRVW